MKKAIAKKWVKALRSGEFNQGQNSLRDKASDTYCCLGVLCAISPFANNYTKMSDGDGAKNCFTPTKVADWAGLEVSNPTVEVDGETRTLAGLNDVGISFERLADIIEANAERL